MAAIVRMYDYLMNFSDPRVSQWPMMASPFPSLIVVGIYLSLIYLFLPAYMKNRKPYKLTNVIRYYNIFQVIACAGLIHLMATSGWTEGIYSFGCQPVDYTINKRALQLLSAFHWTYLLKGVELIETVFFVLRKKFNQVSYLHVYHHASTFLLSWIGCKFIGGGMASFPIMVNSFIHILMYSYYFLATLGPEWQKRLAPWKPKLTMAQMIQFTILIIHSLSALQPSCRVPRVFLVLYLPNVVLIFKMFYDFYKKSYESNTQKPTMNGHVKNGKTKLQNGKEVKAH